MSNPESTISNPSIDVDNNHADYADHDDASHHLLVDEEGMATCLVDDDGNLIDPAAEGSYLMAEGMLEMLREQTGDYTAEVELEPYVPDFDVPQRYAQSLAFFADEKQYIETHKEDGEVIGEAVKGAGEEKHHTDTTQAVATAPAASNPALDYDGECDDDDDDDEGMFPAMSSRVLTADEEWVLEKIIKRRVNKDPKGEGGPHIYYCKWRGYEEPTWETREVMEEAGFIPELDAFDSKDKAHQVKRVRHSNKRLSKYQCQARLESFFGASDLDIIHRHLMKESFANFKVHHYAKMNPFPAEPFYYRWKSLKDTHVPTLVFHGTRPVNLPSIYRMGLVIGGTKGVRVENGTAFGRGVYTARSPDTPMCYGHDSGSVIVCVGLVPTELVNKPRNDVEAHSVYSCSSDYLIFRNAEDVYPMWLVQCDGDEKELTTKPTEISAPQFISEAQSAFGRFGRIAESLINPRRRGTDITISALNEQENKEMVRAVAELKCANGKGFSKAALKAQPRRIKEMLALAAQERNAKK